MAKKAAANTEELVKQALIALATADGPMRLIGKGDHPALLAGTAAANKDVIARLQHEGAPLIAESGAAKKATVSLTAAGFALVAGAIPEEKVGPAARAIAESLPLAERVAFLQEIVRRTPPAAAELLPVIEAAAVEEKAAAEARVKAAAAQRERDAATLEAIKRWEAVIVSRKAARIAALQQELAAEGAEPVALPVVAKAEEKPAPRPAAVAVPQPESADDTTFQRQVARRLVSAWLETWDPDQPGPRQFLEAAIWNVAEFKQVGDAGEDVKFDGRYHEGPAGLFTNSPAKVTRPGWVLKEGDDGEYILAKARVVPK
ncbi:unnamed protein product [Gemmataceae bacterium]|nr:unnamed protein product [Gemmataceae bacterium]VTT99423.1 unnamed protein product [Gemmataceae bacterium]